MNRRRAAASAVAGLLLFASGLAGQEEPDLGPANRGKPPIRTATEALTGVHGIGLPVPPELNEGKLDPELLREVLAATLPNLGAPKRRRRAFLWLYAGGALSDFTQLESTACDQAGLDACSADAIGIGPVLGVRVRPFGGVPLAIGLEGGRSAVSTMQMYSNPPLPETSTVDLAVWTATASVDALVRVDPRTVLSASIGWVWSWNRARITSVFGSERLVERRRSDGGRAMVGAGIERDLSGRLSTRGEIRFIDGAASDADRHLQLRVLFAYRVSR